MATYSSRLRLTLPATGEYTNTWGAVVNDGITALVDDSISGTSAITIAGTDYTLTSVNGSTDEARRMFIVATGTPGAARNVICPAVTKLYSITNNTTGGFALTLKTSAGTGISVPNGATMLLKCDGTNVVQAASTFTDVAYTGTLTGGTGVVNLGAGQLYKDASGNVGIGTASPGYKLTVAGTSPTIVAADTGANTTRAYVSATNAQVSYGATYSGGAVPIVFGIGLAAGVPASEWMRLDASGNLGVGTTSTAISRLNVTYSATAYSAIAAFINSSTGTGGYCVQTFSQGATGSATGVIGTGGSTSSNAAFQNTFVVGTQTTHPLVFTTNDTERMRLDASGNQINSPSNTPPTLTVNGQMNLTPTSNTNMRISYRGSDGVTRVANITLA